MPELKEFINSLRKSHTERDIEVPWAWGAINGCIGTWLDVGYTWTEPDYWSGVDFKGEHSIGLDIAPDRGGHSFAETVIADATTYDFPEVDLITCISTLEHIGTDVSRYALKEYRRDDPFALQQEAVRRMRVAKRLLVSVPFGMAEDHGWFLQYDLAMVNQLDPSKAEFYRIDGTRAEPEELSNCLYNPNELRASAVALLEFNGH